MSRDIEDLLAQRGVIVSYESVRLWRAMYIHERPHSGLGYRTPEEFAETHRKQEEKQAHLSQNFAETLAWFLGEVQLTRRLTPVQLHRLLTQQPVPGDEECKR